MEILYTLSQLYLFYKWILSRLYKNQSALYQKQTKTRKVNKKKWAVYF